MVVPKAEFRRRLERLVYAINRYFYDGSSADLYSSLFSVFSLLWCKNPHVSLEKFVKDG